MVVFYEQLQAEVHLPKELEVGRSVMDTVDAFEQMHNVSEEMDVSHWLETEGEKIWML